MGSDTRLSIPLFVLRIRSSDWTIQPIVHCDRQDGIVCRRGTYSRRLERLAFFQVHAMRACRENLALRRKGRRQP